MTISREAQSIIDYIESTGLPYRVTDVNGPGHAEGSYHYRAGTGGDGLAVDFAGTIPGVTPTTAKQMFDIWRALWLAAPQLAELIHSGEGISQAIKNGRPVDGRSFYGPVVWPDHRDHVHVAVERGTFLGALSHPLVTLEENMPDDPNTPNLFAEILGFYPVVNTTTGECTGYYVVAKDGELHAFGPGAQFFGRSEVVS